MSRKPGITAAVLRYIEQKPRGTVVYRDEVASAVGYSATQVASAVYHIANRKGAFGFAVETVVLGKAWRLVEKTTPAAVPAAAPTPDGPQPIVAGQVFECIAVTKNGTVLLQDETGETWKAVRV